MDEWKRAAEQIAVSQTIQGTRLLGIIAPTNATNSSLLARMISEAMGRSGLEVLLADLNIYEGDQGDAAAGTEPWGPVQQSPSHNIDIVRPHVTAETRDIFNNNSWLNRYFSEQRRKYASIVLDLPPILGGMENQLMPLAAASICDAVILMCSAGRITHSEIDKGVRLLKAAKVALIGIVVDEADGKMVQAPERPRQPAMRFLQSGNNEAERLNS